MTEVMRRINNEIAAIFDGIHSLIVDGIGSIVQPIEPERPSVNAVLRKDAITIGEDLQVVINRISLEGSIGQEEEEEAEPTNEEQPKLVHQ